MNIKNKHKKILQELIAYREVGQLLSSIDSFYNDWDEKAFKEEYGFSFAAAEKAVAELQDFLSE